jgi:hypothetical protein
MKKNDIDLVALIIGIIAFILSLINLIGVLIENQII